MQQLINVHDGDVYTRRCVFCAIFILLTSSFKTSYIEFSKGGNVKEVEIRTKKRYLREILFRYWILEKRTTKG